MIVFKHNEKEVDITLEGTDNKIDWFRYQTLCRID